MNRRWSRLALLFAALLVLAAPVFAQEAKRPIPSDADQQQAMTLAREVYGEEYKAAKTADEKRALAEKLLQKASESKSDAASHFVLLKLARDVAMAGGEADLALRAVEEMIASFEVTGLTAKHETLTKAAQAARSPKQKEAVAQAAIALIDEAIAADDFEIASEAAKLGLVAAREARKKEIVASLVSRSKEVEDFAAEYGKAKEAISLLKGRPVDSTLNIAVGKYLCFVKSDWDQGLPMLALGSDENLKTLAVQELKGVSDANDQAKLADSWWDLAENQSGSAKQVIQRRAVHWYRQALPSLSGLLKDKVERRLAAIDGASTETSATIKSKHTEGGESPPREKGWIPIFDGRSLKGWQPDQNPEAWSIVDGTVVGSGQKSHLYYRKTAFGNFEAKADVKINSTGNSGFIFRATPHIGRSGLAPVGYQVEIVGGGPMVKYHTGSVGVSLPSVAYRTLAPVERKLIMPDVWFNLHLTAVRNHITVEIDGQKVADLTDPESLCQRGYIVLQAWGNPGQTQVSFKNIMIKPLP